MVIVDMKGTRRVPFLLLPVRVKIKRKRHSVVDASFFFF